MKVRDVWAKFTDQSAEPRLVSPRPQNTIAERRKTASLAAIDPMMTNVLLNT
jgi:hypothetical protein